MDLRTTIIPLTALALLVVCGALLVPSGFSEEAIRASIRITANTSFLLLLLALSASALYRQLGPRWQGVLRARRRIGIAFAVSHTYHLATILLLLYLVFDGNVEEFGGILPGTLVYVVIYTMAFTSNDWSVRRLGAKNWRRLHLVGAYILLLAFTGNYLAGAISYNNYHWFYATLGLAVLVLRWLPGKQAHA